MLGCTNAGSSNGGPDGGPVPTSHMYLHVHLESSDTITTDVSARLDDGLAFGTQYRLNGGDYLRACLGSVCKNLRDSITAIDVLFPFFPDGYSAGFPVRSDIDYAISFNRADSVNAPNTFVRLPAAFDIQSPVQDLNVTDGDVVQVSWYPSGAGYNVYVDTDADCTHINGLHSQASGPTLYDSNGDGSAALRIDDVVAAARGALLNPTALYDCDIDITVYQENSGTIDRAFAGGDIKAVAKRRVNIHYFPSR